MSKNYELNRYYRLKAILKGKNQKIKQLKKLARDVKETNLAVLKSCYREQEELENELEETQAELAESKRKKWYQFISIEK